MNEYAAEASPDSDHSFREPTSGRPRGHTRLSRRGGLNMIAVTAERLAIAESHAGVSGYLPAIPADSEDRSFD